MTIKDAPRTARYKQYAGRHGQDAAGNPSGGNLFRGLYNIVMLAVNVANSFACIFPVKLQYAGDVVSCSYKWLDQETAL